MSVLGFRKEGAPSLLRPSYQLLALSFQFFFFPTELEKREVGRGRILENTGVCVRSGVLSPPPPSLCPQPCSGEGGLHFTSVLSRLGLICMRMSGAGGEGLSWVPWAYSCCFPFQVGARPPPQPLPK